MSDASAMRDQYLTQYQHVNQQLPGITYPWIQDLRQQALTSFARLGFPTQRQEDWKYTSLRSIERNSFAFPAQSCIGLIEDDLADVLMLDLDSHRLTFVNGVYTPQLSKPGNPPQGVSLVSLAKQLDDDAEHLQTHLANCAPHDFNGFVALNTAFMRDGAYVHISPGVVVDRPIHLVFVSTTQSEPTWCHPRNLLIADDDSQATVIETYACLGDSVYLNNVTTEVIVGRNAQLEHHKLQQESIDAFHVALLQVRQQRDSRFISHSLSFGGKLVRNDIRAALEAEGCECILNGLYVVNDRQHVDYHTLVDHEQPNSTSRETYKGVLGGRSRAVFNGVVKVHPDAQKSDAEQSNKNLLLSSDAEVDTKPQLEIYADDVKCSHGATVGQLDENMLFYLRARGIGHDMARGLLTYGFAHDVVDQVRFPQIRAHVEDILINKLPNAEYIRDML